MSRFSTKDIAASTQSAGGHLIQVQSVGKFKEVCVIFLGPASYDAGGSEITAEQLGLTWINYAMVVGTASGDRVGHVIYPHNTGPNKTIKILITDLAGAEVAGASNQSAKEFRIVAQGAY